MSSMGLIALWTTQEARMIIIILHLDVGIFIAASILLLARQ